MKKTVCGYVLFPLMFLAWVSYAATENAEAKKVRQKLRIDKTEEVKNKSGNYEDAEWREAECMKDSIIFSGYDKPISASKEAMLASNRSAGCHVAGVRLEIIYKDMAGRMLHSRTVFVGVDLPPGQTRKAEFKSWDSQKSYYYYLSQKPRREAIPYQIEIRPLSYLLKR